MANPRAPRGPAHPPPHQSGRRRGTDLLPLFWKFLDAVRLGPGKLQLSTVRAGRPRVQLGCSSGPWRPPGMAPRSPAPARLAVARGPVPEPAPLPAPGVRPAAGGADLSIRRGSPPSSPSRSGPADTGVGGAESLLAGRGGRLLRWNRRVAGPPWPCGSRLQPRSTRLLTSPATSLASPRSLEN